MKKRKYYRLAEKSFPNVKDRKILAMIADTLRLDDDKESSK